MTKQAVHTENTFTHTFTAAEVEKQKLQQLLQDTSKQRPSPIIRLSRG
jgi:hypothetical protein